MKRSLIYKLWKIFCSNIFSTFKLIQPNVLQVTVLYRDIFKVVFERFENSYHKIHWHLPECTEINFFSNNIISRLGSHTNDNLFVIHLQITKAPIYQFAYIFLLKKRPTATKRATRLVFIFLFQSETFFWKFNAWIFNILCLMYKT